MGITSRYVENNHPVSENQDVEFKYHLLGPGNESSA
jgi:hypothetical protein